MYTLKCHYYINALLFGLPHYLFQRLQYVQNAAARLIAQKRKYDHVTQIRKALHWLPIKHRIDFKVLVHAYKAQHNLSQQPPNFGMSYPCLFANVIHLQISNIISKHMFLKRHICNILMSRQGFMQSAFEQDTGFWGYINYLYLFIFTELRLSVILHSKFPFYTLILG